MNNYVEYFANLGPLEIAGVCGFFVYILAFGLVQASLLNGNSATYSLLNVLAAALVAFSLLAEFNLSSALIQASWIVIGLTGFSIRAFKSVKHANENSISIQHREAN